MRVLASLFLGLACAGPVRSASDAATTEPPIPGQSFRLAAPDLAMLWVAPGKFLASSPLAQEDDTEVTLSRGYWLAQTETTEEQWLAVVTDIALTTRRGPRFAAQGIQWESAMRFCELLNERERAAGRLPPGYLYSLPTEAQWEYACRAGTTGPFAGEIDALAWHRENSGGLIQTVATKLPNAWGFHDLHGNVSEWCADYYQPYPGGQVTDPRGPPIEQFRVMRGGSVSHGRGGCRSDIRYWMRSSVSGVNLMGFRVALVPAAGPGPAR
jgi:formylglycine-generating enzyme required for sulfatase activity